MSATNRSKRPGSSSKLSIGRLLRPHWHAFLIGFVAVLGETVTDILEPWPIKIVVDNTLQARKLPGWISGSIANTFGQNKLATLDFAVAAVLAIAVLGAISSYIEKYMTTSASQWVAHDLRRTLYNHIRRLALAQYDETRTGDLVSRVTSDVDAIQTFINSALLGSLVSALNPSSACSASCFTSTGNSR